MSAQLIEVVRLKELLRCEMANHSAFRAQIYLDPEFKAIIERRDKEKHAERTQRYIDRLLKENEDLASLAVY
jgi:hypothetical protein